jgi:hypothetical protein
VPGLGSILERVEGWSLGFSVSRLSTKQNPSRDHRDLSNECISDYQEELQPKGIFFHVLNISNASPFLV